MKADEVPIIWTASGNLGTNPIDITFTYQDSLGVTIWTAIIYDEVNDGVYYWTVPAPAPPPNDNQPHVNIKIEVTDLDGNVAQDTCDVSFAIDPPLETGNVPVDEYKPQPEETNTKERNMAPQPLNTGLIGFAIILLAVALYSIMKRKRSINKGDDKANNVKEGETNEQNEN
jgi:hypothetical protein